MIKVSIVVPVYNVERYLAPCLDSIRNQSYSNIEIVCVNDGSRDRSRDILAMYQSVDARIKVVDKENGGLSSARNAGIAAATGDVVCFVDSDDMITRDAAAVIASIFESTSADVVTFGGSAYPSFKSYPWLDRVLSPRDVIYDTFTPDIFEKEACDPFAWRTACRRDFLLAHGVAFDEELRFGEDKLFLYSIYPRSSKTVFVSNKLYLYRLDREGSLMSSRAEDRHLRLYDHLRIFHAIVKDWSDAGFIESYGSELLHLGCEFLIVDLLSAPKTIRVDLLNFLAAIWTVYFSREQIDGLLSDPQYGSLIDAVLVNRKRAYGVSHKMMFYAYSLHSDPRDFFSRVWQRVKTTGIIGRFGRSVSSRLPLSRRAAAGLLESVVFEQQDASMCSQALKMIQLESSQANYRS